MYLCLSRDGQHRKVFIINDAASLGTLPSNDIRISPIFPVSSTRPPVVPDLTANCYILFLFPKVPFSTIGRLCGILNDERLNHLWFSHGLASLLIINNDKIIIDEIRELVKDDISASELWTINSGYISIPPEITYPTSEIPELILPDFVILPVDIQSLLVEYSSIMRVAITRASHYLPFHTRALIGIHSQVVSLVNSLIFLFDDLPDSGITKFQEEIDIKEDSKKRLQYSKGITDRILQINSALSYVVTQGYTGTVPIVEHECSLYSFSLLGIGNSFAAISKIYESISIVFAKYPIARTIRDQYEKDRTNIPLFKENYIDYDVDEWRKYERILDEKLDISTSNRTDQMFHLSYFSGTQGFRESLYGISAAIQTLTSSAMPRWTLLTLTHEYLHAHVRALMAVLFQETTEEKFKELYDNYIKVGTTEEVPSDTNLRQRLFFIILSACEYMLMAKSAAAGIRDGKSGKSEQPDLNYVQALKLLAEYNTEINEYIVHTLDYLYFYESNRETYIELLWFSWSTIPAIYEKLSHYLLRTLLAISVDVRGDIGQRFESSCQAIKDAFKKMLASGKTDDPFIIEQALDLLKNKRENSALRHEFLCTVRIADLARLFFHSKSLHYLIKVDELQILDAEGRPYYALNPFEFNDINIQSPIAFIADRAVKNLNSTLSESFESMLKESCWEQIVVSSSALSVVLEEERNV